MGRDGLAPALLIVDDDKSLCRVLDDFFSTKPFRVFIAHNGMDGLDLCARNFMDVIIHDQKLPDGEGTKFLPQILAIHPQAKIIFITAFPEFQEAVSAIKSGAYDFLSKPFDLDELNLMVNQSLRTLKLEKIEQVQLYQRRRKSEQTVLIGKKKGLKDVWELVELAAASHATVFITGETGTGKGILARTIHYLQYSKSAPFIYLNCAAIPESLMEAELFGSEKGAFTGAVGQRKGVFELAEGGSLFLDEIGELPLHLQSKLLGVLDEKKVRRIGGKIERKLNVRVIAATNADVDQEMQQKRFRKDLYHRLNVLRIIMPPLKERLEDIGDLSRYFINELAPGSHIDITEDEIERLKSYDWPGNVREFRNVIERSLMVQKFGKISPFSVLSGNFLTSSQNQKKRSERENIRTLEDVEKEHIQFVVQKFSNNFTKSAKSLGISRSTLKRKLRKYGAL
ncbi:MAG: hypothetical protein B6244_12160 [Candidatus Cloacimonetes bacterium 4572_55]|nr:MAG: hypothetical protein B6244_12160 [Candidatus Cloacimonetes bacterium 4572_55]